jgi:hypothetical protein
MQWCIMPVAPMACNGMTYIPLQGAAMHQFSTAAAYPSGALSLGQNAQPEPASPELAVGTASNYVQEEQPSSKKSGRKVVNQKVKQFKAFELKFIRKVWEVWRCLDVKLALRDESDATEVAVTAAKFQEQVLRLALLGSHKQDADVPVSESPLRRTRSLIADFVSVGRTTLTERTYSETVTTSAERTHSASCMSDISTALTGRTYSLHSDTASCADSISLDGDFSRFDFLGGVPTWELCRAPPGVERRIGVDLGGVVFEQRATGWVRKALDGVRGLVRIFGADNVFIVSKVQLHGSMHNACRRELTRQGGFLEKSGVLLENVVFVPTVSGAYGKGAVSARLGLTHFVDDRVDVLKSICSDEAGNSGDLVRRFDGRLFHFEHGGRGTHTPSQRSEMPVDFRDHYHPVSGWPELLACFGKTGDYDQVQPLSTVFTKSVVEEHRIPIGADGDAASRVISLLRRGSAEIEDSTSVRILIRGKGSPQPQPATEEQGPLSIVVRTRLGGSLDLAVSQIESLLRDVLTSTV